MKTNVRLALLPSLLMIYNFYHKVYYNISFDTVEIMFPFMMTNTIVSSVNHPRVY